MKQWDKGQQVIFEANPDYYGEEIKIKKLTVLFMDEDAALAAAMAGQADVAHTAASYADQVIDGYQLLRVASVDNRGINLPTVSPQERDSKPIGNAVTSDAAVRRAINIGIDREEMIDNVLNGYGTPAYSVCDKMPGIIHRRRWHMIRTLRSSCLRRPAGSKAATASGKKTG